MYIRGQLERRFGLEAIYTQGLQVYTTLDLDMQNHAQRVAQYRLEQLAEAKDGSPPRNVRNAAIVILDPNTGEILTMLGSPDYFDPRIDGAVNATVASRQPGSSIKPITYAAAFDPQLAARYGYPPLTAATMMMDVRTAFLTKEGDPYVPQNYYRLYAINFNRLRHASNTYRDPRLHKWCDDRPRQRDRPYPGDVRDRPSSARRSRADARRDAKAPHARRRRRCSSGFYRDRRPSCFQGE
jgi:membrane carboxypeptidase/penicillin-binding protein